MRAGLFLAFLSLGIVCLVGGLFITRQTWRPEIEPFGRRSKMFQIALHPERFARPERLRSIRALNFAGAIFILCALVVVGLDVISGIPGTS
jgi:hypothetical protein